VACRRKHAAGDAPARARDEHVPLAQVNLVGANDELIFDGHSGRVGCAGEVIGLERFAETFWWLNSIL